MHPVVYFEKRTVRAFPWLIMLAVCALMLMLWMPNERPWWLKYTVLGLGIFSIIGLTQSLNPQAAIVIEEDALILRGVRPGAWKLFQMWHRVRVKYANIAAVRICYGESGLGQGHKVEPSRNSRFQLFLWIEYLDEENMEQIYFPHMKNIKDYEMAIDQLKIQLGDRCHVESK